MKRNIVIAAVAATVLAGGGTAAAVAAAGDGGAAGDAPSRPGAAAGEGSEDSGRSGGDDRERAGTARTTVAEAVRAALEARAGTAASAELDDEDDRPVWEIEVLGRKGTWYEVRVDAGSGKVTGVAEDDEDGDEDGGDRGERESLQRAATDLGGAAGAAVKQTPGTVTSVEFEGRDDDGDTGRDGAWEVEILAKDGTEREVRVDAGTGKATGAGAAAQDSGDDRDGREARGGDDRDSGKDDDREDRDGRDDRDDDGDGREDDKHDDRKDDDRDDSRSDG
ncbi:PepSY domain-containing protein [Streptomyces sp. WAC 00631]|uniref:PepSY domain-containing protein n=1 Tax=Streptomyces sp. WAC 00631 TaxID=2203201 RepID=UPI000F7A2F13|nr:PepSY domain-containing protein [Streptomyces sp. WAC 00631]MCC5035613.1 PepSY domain-containing protein [Streptomyces sp. WAC 00631]